MLIATAKFVPRVQNSVVASGYSESSHNLPFWGVRGEGYLLFVASSLPPWQRCSFAPYRFCWRISSSRSSPGQACVRRLPNSESIPSRCSALSWTQRSLRDAIALCPPLHLHRCRKAGAVTRRIQYFPLKSCDVAGINIIIVYANPKLTFWIINLYCRFMRRGHVFFFFSSSLFAAKMVALDCKIMNSRNLIYSYWLKRTLKKKKKIWS